MISNVTKGSDEKFCSSCGAVIKIVAEICPKCGVRQMAATYSGNPNASKKSRTATLILCIFFGVLGVHSFYTSKIGVGIARLFIFILGYAFIILGLGITADEGFIIIGYIFILIGSIWTFIDFILILAGKFKDKEGKRVLNW